MNSSSLPLESGLRLFLKFSFLQMKLILLLGFVALASTFSVDTDPIAEDAVADRLEETDNKVAFFLFHYNFILVVGAG